MIGRTVAVADPQGIHALLAHRLCQSADGFSSSIWIVSSGQRRSLATPFPLLALGVASGAEVLVCADGIDEAEALEAVCALLTAP